MSENEYFLANKCTMVHNIYSLKFQNERIAVPSCRSHVKCQKINAFLAYKCECLNKRITMLKLSKFDLKSVPLCMSVRKTQKKPWEISTL